MFGSRVPGRGATAKCSLLPRPSCYFFNVPRKRSRVLVFVLGAFLLACGPSLQTLYEGEARFEHCYALDLTPTATHDDQEACWKVWRERYAERESRDRARYASARYRTLSAGRGSLPDAGAAAEAGGPLP